jgi:SAM-dependent methyltransferase
MEKRDLAKGNLRRQKDGEAERMCETYCKAFCHECRLDWTRLRRGRNGFALNTARWRLETHRRSPPVQVILGHRLQVEKVLQVPDYVDYAEYYDYDHGNGFDVSFYLEYARSNPGRVLELACGTGRVLLPMARAGFETWGLDLSSSMLARCREKAHQLGVQSRVHLSQADMASFDLAVKDFSLIYVPVRSFMHLFSHQAQLQCLQCAHRHLTSQGQLIVDVYAPLFEAFVKSPDQGFSLSKEYTLDNGHTVRRYDRFVRNDRAQQIQHCEMKFEEADAMGTVLREKIVPMDTRYTFRYELQLLFEKAGFTVEDVFRDYDRNAFDGTGEIVMVGRKV